MKTPIISQNLRTAQEKWGRLSRNARLALHELASRYQLSVSRGDVLYLDHSWYVTHNGLLAIARRQRCAGIDVRPLNKFCDPGTSRWVFKATVYRSAKCKGFIGYGDADPSNVSPLVHGAEMRVAETRAVNRALRKAYGIGICSVEELGSASGPVPTAGQMKQPLKTACVTCNGNHPLRDRLCLLIRQHQLDPALVKSYAADYCDVSALRHASRDQVSTFVKHITEYAQSDRDGLLCQLNRYAPKPVCPASATTAGETSVSEEKEAGAA